MATAPEIAPALRADAARNRELILDAAMEVFAERGLDASTSEVARRAGVGEATLFRRFPHKQDLIDAVLERTMREVNELLAECAADPDPARGLERFFFELLERKLQNDRAFFEAVHERCMTSTNFEDLRAEAFDLMTVILRRAQEAGAARTDLQPPDLFFLLLSAGATLRLPQLSLREDLWKRYARVILDGLRPQSPSKLKPGAPSRKLLEEGGE